MKATRFTARVERVLVGLLVQGRSVPEAARAVDIPRPTVEWWLRLGALGDPRYKRLREAYMAPHAARVEGARALARQATALLEQEGTTLRGVAKELGVTYGVLRALVRHGRGRGARWGDTAFRRLALVATRREREPARTCPHCGKPLPKEAA